MTTTGIGPNGEPGFVIEASIGQYDSSGKLEKDAPPPKQVTLTVPATKDFVSTGTLETIKGSPRFKAISDFNIVNRKNTSNFAFPPPYQGLEIYTTGTGGAEARKFMDFCNFQDLYVLSISDYNLYSEIILRFEAYKKDINDSEKHE